MAPGHNNRMKEADSLIPTSYLNTLEQKRYSKNTVKVYRTYFRDFLLHFSGRDPRSISKREIQCIQVRGWNK
jgi:3-isopropylmalate dehydratase small subunit